MKHFQSLVELAGRFQKAGAIRLIAKSLSSNDNSKQQVYLGGSWEAVRILPIADVNTSGAGNTKHFLAGLRLSWIDASGTERPAPHAKLILYPQYPEVRFSGFLRGVADGPVAVMTSRQTGRVLFLGLRRDRTVIAYAATHDSVVARQARSDLAARPTDLLAELPLPDHPSTDSARLQLLQELCRICARGWVGSKQLGKEGQVRPCEAQNCGGLTLEAELGIPKNSRSEADYAGWEIKQFATKQAGLTGHGRITLMTPEPNGGLYATEGAAAFVRAFGYKDLRGRRDRINFGGNFIVGRRASRTRLTLTLDGFDFETRRIVDAGGAVLLVTDDNTVAASWGFAGLMAHWARKHQFAAYVPSQRRLQPRREYRYGPAAYLGEGTDFGLFLSAMAAGKVVYDPGMKLTGLRGNVELKRRSQFRVSVSNLSPLYNVFSTVSLLGVSS